ncbi:MAG TPA: plastocyanin/azurin family copper-binding protein [Symbiobacteriaceae bacterium]|jgi:plastocyanin|nr:plastocyanin/azurin family copper-binding protein [Symbiobacteriaceae bacterium]
MRKLSITILMLLVLFTLAGCGGSEPAESGVVKSGEVTITMKNMKFTPAKVTVKKGTKITFVNKDAILHDVVQVAVKDYGKAEPGFDSKEIMSAGSWSIIMEKTGEFPVICTQAAHFTAGMVGVITVVE